MKPFAWSDKKEAAAQAVAEDRVCDIEIAASAGVNKATLERWKQHPDFRARVQEHRAAYREAVRTRGIAIVENRIGAQNDRWQRANGTLEERGRALDGQCAGGQYGLIVRQPRFVKVFELPRVTQQDLIEGKVKPEDLSDDDFIATKQMVPVDEFAVDTGLLAEIRALEQQAAKELGQWTERSEVKHSGQITIPRGDLKQLSDDELEQLESLALKIAGGGPAGNAPGD